MKFNEDYYNTLTDEIARAEEKTAAELVVVVNPSSGNYRDIDLLVGAIFAWLGLLFFLFSEREFNPIAIPIELAVVFILFSWISSATPLRKLFITSKRRQRQTAEAAARAFTLEEVTHTRARTGLLIYYSIQERELEIIADIGITKSIPPEEWQGKISKAKSIGNASDAAEALRDLIRDLAEILAQYLPATDDNPDELPNRPRVAK